MRNITIFLVSMFIGLALGHIFIGRPLADMIDSALKEHQRIVDEKIKEFEE